MSEILLALGANLPNPEDDATSNIKRAVSELVSHGFTLRAVSRFYETPCFPAGAGPDYVNAAVCVTAPWSPLEVLRVVHAIETKMGRTRETRWGMRSLDIDLIAFDQLVLPDFDVYRNWSDMPAEEQILRAPDQLILPHPRLPERAFVLVPLSDVAPDWSHPVSGLTVMQMLASFSEADLAEVKPM